MYDDDDTQVHCGQLGLTSMVAFDNRRMRAARLLSWEEDFVLPRGLKRTGHGWRAVTFSTRRWWERRLTNVYYPELCETPTSVRLSVF